MWAALLFPEKVLTWRGGGGKISVNFWYGYGTRSVPNTVGYGTRSVPITVGYGTRSVPNTVGYGTRSVPITVGYGTRSVTTTVVTAHGVCLILWLGGMNRWLMRYHLLHIQT